MNLAEYRKKGWTVLVHALAWLILFSLPYLLRPSYDQHHNPPPHDVRFDYDYIINCFIWMGMFYSNANLLLPAFFNVKKYRTYLLSVVLLIALALFFNWLFFYLLLPIEKYHINGATIFFLFPSLFMLASSTTYRMLLDRSEQDRKNKEKETENLKTELSFLRSQVSPHFMFNVLNNMVALARKKSDLLEPSLLKLSGLLRYMLYETDEEMVSLNKEVEYLQSYIDLQQQRFGKNLQVRVNLNDIDEPYSIAPMLLIPFVENAFKHGAVFTTNAFIDINLSAKKGVLTFMVSNKYIHQPDEIKDKTSGIGLANASRRLNLLYAKNHSLLITEKDEVFVVSLHINMTQ